MDFLKTVTGKIISGGLALAVIAGGISWWRMDQATRDVLVSGTTRIVGWLLVMLFLPWATFFLSAKVGKMDSNAASGVLVASYTVVEVLLLAWLFEWRIGGTAAWTFFLAGGLLAGVYNVFTCDWIAEKLE